MATLTPSSLIATPRHENTDATERPGFEVTTVRPVRVLLAEHQEMDFLVVRALLAQFGDAFELDWFRSQDSALAAMSRAEHDICLVDHQFGESDDGLALLRSARAAGCISPVIMLTANRDPEADLAAMRAGAADYLVKGRVDGASLERSIRYAIESARATERLRESERFLASAIDALSTRIAILDEAGRIVAVNLAWRCQAAVPGSFAAGHPLGTSYLDTCAGSAAGGTRDERSVAAGVGAVMDGSRESYERECRLEVDGEERWFNVRITRFAGPGPVRVVVAHEDVTERKMAERALLDREEQLRQSQKMGAVGRLAGGVAHDFNNLLTAIHGYSELLLEKLAADSAEAREAVEIKKAAERASLLTERLLAFGRRQVLRPAVLDLNAVVVDVTRMLERLIGEDITLRSALGTGVHTVLADPGQLEQVLMNLVVNARDAMPEGGDIQLETAMRVLGERRPDPDLEPGPYVVLRVTDRGTGMDADTLAHLFEPFFTTKAAGEGTGLGLSTVYGIVRQSGGYIGVDSTLGTGATFEILLPWVEAEPDRPQPTEAFPAATAGTETVLVVEDEDGVRALVTEVLELNGYRVLVANAGPAALELQAAHADEQIHLLISDVVMPEMSGRVLRERLQPLRPDMKVLFVSGYTEDEVIRQGIEKRDVAFLQKPFTVASLASTVRDVLDGKLPAAAPGRAHKRSEPA